MQSNSLTSVYQYEGFSKLGDVPGRIGKLAVLNISEEYLNKKRLYLSIDYLIPNLGRESNQSLTSLPVRATNTSIDTIQISVRAHNAFIISYLLSIIAFSVDCVACCHGRTIIRR